MKYAACILSLVVVLGWGATVKASDPTGIYARIDKVVLEPKDGAPERIQIWGTFMFAKGRPGDEYEKPARGYLYYAIVKGKEDKCRKEWADLQKVAAKDQCVGLASRYGAKGTLRTTDSKPEKPDAYPLAMGVVKVNASNPQAKALMEKGAQ
jgi:hypothetical protein